jgi:hypothetical protein
MADPVAASDTATNNTDVARFYTETSTGAFRAIEEDRIAHSANMTVADKGKIFYVDANGEVVPLAPGTQNYVLRISSGGLPEWAVAGNQLSQIGAKQSFSTQTASVAFTSIASSGYSRFILVGINVISADNALTDTLLIQVSTNNGSSYKTASGDYYDGTTPRTFLASVTIPGSNSTFQYGAFSVELMGLGNASRPTYGFKEQGFYGQSATNVGVITTNSNGATRVAAEADNAIRAVTLSGANMASGTFILYGVVEA